MPKTHLQRTGENLAPNPAFQGPAQWTLVKDTQFDRRISSTRDGTGSLRFSRPGANFMSHPILLPGPGMYLLAAMLRTSNGPAYLTTQFKKDRGGNKGNSGRVTTSEDGQWEEMVTTIELDPAESRHIRVHFNAAEFPNPDAHIWVDDVFFAKADIGFLRGPAEKRAFEGTRVRVDSLGNFETLERGTWTPFFPFGIYTNSARKDWRPYSRQGFNINMWASVRNQVQKARDAGLRSAVDLTGYMIAGHDYYNKAELLLARLREMFEASQQSAIVWYYVDNEKSWKEWDVTNRIITAVHEADSEDGRRMHPVYFLQGNPNAARRFSQAGICDVAGTYVGHNSPSLAVLDNLERQTAPAAIAQINGLSAPGEFRDRLYSSLIQGAKGCGYWRDGGSQPDVTTQRWWPDIPHLSAEVAQLMPLIRTEHWTRWSAASSNNRIVVGTRNYDQKPHLILVNRSPLAQRVTVQVSGLGFRSGTVTSYFDGTEVAQLKDSRFTHQIPGLGVRSGTAVLALERDN